MLKGLNFIHRFIDVCSADGKRRIKLALQNILYILLSAVCFWLLIKVYDSRFGGDTDKKFALWLLAWIAVIALAVLTLEFLLLGGISQILLFFCALFGIFSSEQKGKNAIAFLLALLSFGMAIFLFYFTTVLFLIDALKNL